MFRRLNDVLRPASSAARDGGLSLIEVIVAMMVFAVISTGTAYAIASSLIITRESRAREVATNLAAADVDHMRAIDDIMDVTSTTSPEVSTVSGAEFQLTRFVEWVTATDAGVTTGTDDCGSGAGSGAAAVGGALQYKRVTVTVSYTGQRSTVRSVTNQTLLSSDTRLNTPETGTIIVSVKGAGGAGTSGVAVTLSKATTPNGAQVPAAQPEPTDVQGCSYALKVVPGNYVVSIAKANGIGFDQKNVVTTTPKTTVQVKAGSSASALFTFDVSAVMNLTYDAQGATLPTDLTTTFTGTVGNPLVQAMGSTRSLRLFPSSYTVVAGSATSDCLSPTPASWMAPAPDKAVGRAAEPLTLTPGSTVSATVPLAVTTVQGLPTSTYTLKAQSVAGPTGDDPGCATTPNFTFPSSRASSQKIALPYGTWRLSYASGSSTIPLGLLNIAPVTRGSVDLLGTLQLDPRTVAP